MEKCENPDCKFCGEDGLEGIAEHVAAILEPLRANEYTMVDTALVLGGFLKVITKMMATFQQEDIAEAMLSMDRQTAELIQVHLALQIGTLLRAMRRMAQTPEQLTEFLEKLAEGNRFQSGDGRGSGSPEKAHALIARAIP